MAEYGVWEMNRKSERRRPDIGVDRRHLYTQRRAHSGVADIFRIV